MPFSWRKRPEGFHHVVVAHDFAAFFLADG